MGIFLVVTVQLSLEVKMVGYFFPHKMTVYHFVQTNLPHICEVLHFAKNSSSLNVVTLCYVSC